MGKFRLRDALLSAEDQTIRHFVSLVLIVMTIKTQQLPVATVGRVIVVVVVFVMDGELTQFLSSKISPTTPAYVGVHFQSPRAVGLFLFLLVAPYFGNKGVRV